MSCKHGNWEPCDQCDEEIAEWRRAVAEGKKEASEHIRSFLACEIECEIFETKVLPALERAILSMGEKQ